MPDQSIIIPSYFPEKDYVVAIRDEGYAFFYYPTGWSAEIQLDKLGAKTINAYWFDPRKGEAILIDSFAGTGTRKYTPPTTGRGNDSVLVIDDASKNFKIPGLIK